MTTPARVFPATTTVDSFAGFPVTDYPAAAGWYERLLGVAPTFLPNDIEAVWELAEHRYLFIKVLPGDAGHAYNLFFLGDLDAFATAAAERGVVPANRETLENGPTRLTYHDPDGNEVAFGGMPA